MQPCLMRMGMAILISISYGAAMRCLQKIPCWLTGCSRMTEKEDSVCPEKVQFPIWLKMDRVCGRPILMAMAIWICLWVRDPYREPMEYHPISFFLKIMGMAYLRMAQMIGRKG